MSKSFRNDLTGMRFNSLLALRFIPDNSKVTRWLFICDCGVEKVMPSHGVVNGLVKSCGCGRSKDISGFRYNRLVVVSISHKDKKGQFYWICDCDCGKRIVARGNHLRSGNIQSCGCFSVDRARELGFAKRGYRLDEAAFEKLYDGYQRIKSARKHGNSLTKADALSLFHSRCYYCNIEPRQERHTRYGSIFIYNGLDRFDNDKGYTVGNAVACCGMCNSSKRDRDYGSFVSWLRIVRDHTIDKPLFLIDHRRISDIEKSLIDVKLYKASNGRWRLPDGESVFNLIYDRHRFRKEWHLTKAELRYYCENRCYYCNTEPYTTLSPKHGGRLGAFTYNGIDRLDSKLGYTLDNCVPCCVICNRAKLDHSVSDFYAWVNRVCNNLCI